MKEIEKYIYILLSLFLINNLIIIINDKELLGELYAIDEDNLVFIENIHINKVFSNSFFFTTKPNLQLIPEKQLYMIQKHDTDRLIYFRVNTIKKNDTLYFFQHIDWVTERSRKIETGIYSLNKIVKDK